MIECLATAHLNRPDLTQRMIASIDFPVRHLLLVNNGNDKLHELNIPGFVMERHEIVNMDNLGVSGAWNQCLHFAFVEHDLDSVLIVGNDVEWHVGDLDRIHQTVVDFPEADFVFGNHSFSNFLVKRSGWEKCGWFDENFLYGYWEDGDAWRKIILSGAKAIHAAGLHAKHEGSSTIKSDLNFKRKMDEVFQRNARYYASKWGCPVGSSAKETFTTPFNKGGDIKAWRLSVERMRHPYFRSHGL